MSADLPPPPEIAGHYDRLLRELDGEYIHHRWGNSAVKRRHYRQTELALRYALGHLRTIGDVLEVGCGPAVWTTLFLAQSRSVSLLDISEEMLAHARVRLEQWKAGSQIAKVRYIRGDFIEADLEEESYDTIVSARAFEYMSDKQAFVSKCFSLLRQGGTLVLVTKNKGWHDLAKAAVDFAGVPRKDIPVGLAMQLDLVSWREAIAMFAVSGFAGVAAYPVIIGSYNWSFLARGPGLALADVLHSAVYRRPINSLTQLVGPLMESYSVIGTKAR